MNVMCVASGLLANRETTLERINRIETRWQYIIYTFIHPRIRTTTDLNCHRVRNGDE